MTSKKEKSKERRDGLIYFLEELRNAADTVIDYTAEAKISFARHVTKEKEQFKELVQYLQPRLLHKILEREGDHHERILNFVLSLPAINQSLLLREFADEERESVLEGCEEGKKQQINENLARLKLIENSEQDQKIPLTSRDDPGSSNSSQVHVALAAKTTNTKQPGTSSAKTGAASSEVVRKKEGNNGDKGRRGKSSNDSSDESSKENNQENHKKGGEESRDDKTDESSTDESSTDESSTDESSTDESSSSEEED
jgi:hypothetical protein